MSSRRRQRRPALLALAISGAISWAPMGRAQAIQLEIRPRVGDTLHLRLEQDVEMTTGRRGRSGAPATTERTSMLLLSRVIVDQSDESGSIVRTITDSIASSTANVSAQAAIAALRQSLQGQPIRVRISRQGQATLLEAPDTVPRDVQSVYSQVPATLPKHPVAPGASWSQTIVLPATAGERTAKDGASLRATFRLDSLTADETLAYISMRGRLVQDSTAAKTPSGVRVPIDGDVTGNFVVDRRRGWIIDAATQMSVKSVLSPTAGRPGSPRPMHMRMRQRMRTVERAMDKP